MDKNLLALLVCPLCKGGLTYDRDQQELVCKIDKLAYPIVKDIPVMLPERARRMAEEK